MGNNIIDRWRDSGGFLRRKGLFPIISVILIILLLIQAVRLVWMTATPIGPVGDWRVSGVQMLSPQSRMALFSNFDPFFRNALRAAGNVITSLQLTLYGIRMNEGSGLGSAILAGPDGVQVSYAVSEEVMPGVTLDSVHFDHVVIDRGGIKESLYIDQSVPAETVTPTEVIVETNDPLDRVGTTTNPPAKAEQPSAQPDQPAKDTQEDKNS